MGHSQKNRYARRSLFLAVVLEANYGPRFGCLFPFAVTESTFMNQPFRPGPSLFRLLDDAPIGALLNYVRHVTPDATALDMALADAKEDADIRTRLSAWVGELPAERQRRLEDEADRVLAVVSEGEWALNHAVRHELDGTERAEYDAQMDGLGRSLWSWLRRSGDFANAESLHHAARYRGHGRLFEAFEVDAERGADLDWSDDLVERLQDRAREALDLPRQVSVVHLTFNEGDEDRLTHVVIMRHPGPLSSIAELLPDGAKSRHYYCPANEATLFYVPSLRRVEICALSPSVRQQAVGAFAETALGQDLSKKPLTAFNYDLARFYRSFELPIIDLPGVALHAVRVTEVAVRPNHPKRRFSLEVAKDDDIEDVSEQLFGRTGMLRRSGSFSRIAITVVYSLSGEKGPRNLKITLTDANKCDLRANADPRLRRLGGALLEAWGVQTACRAPTKSELTDLFPAILALYDMSQDEVLEEALVSQGLDVGALLHFGALQPGGRYDTALIDPDDAGPAEVEFGATQNPEVARVIDAEAGAVRRPAALVRRLRVRREWVEELILKQITGLLDGRVMRRLDAYLLELGPIRLGARTVRCFLARGLGQSRIWGRIDADLRSRNLDAALVLAGSDMPKWIGGHVIVPLCEVLGEPGSGKLISPDQLATLYEDGLSAGRAAVRVRLDMTDGLTGTLVIPGKPPLSVVGRARIGILEKLVQAYLAGNPEVQSKALMAGTSMRSPSQAFRPWAAVGGVYIEKGAAPRTWRLSAG